MCQALCLYELCQHSATCVQALRCHHTVTPQCDAPTHSKKKNPLREKPFLQSNMSTIHASRGFARQQPRVFLFEVCNNDSYVLRDMALA